MKTHQLQTITSLLARIKNDYLTSLELEIDEDVLADTGLLLTNSSTPIQLLRKNGNGADLFLNLEGTIYEFPIYSKDVIYNGRELTNAYISFETPNGNVEILIANSDNLAVPMEQLAEILSLYLPMDVEKDLYPFYRMANLQSDFTFPGYTTQNQTENSKLFVSKDAKEDPIFAVRTKSNWIVFFNTSRVESKIKLVLIKSGEESNSLEVSVSPTTEEIENIYKKIREVNKSIMVMAIKKLQQIEQNTVKEEEIPSLSTADKLDN